MTVLLNTEAETMVQLDTMGAASNRCVAGVVVVTAMRCTVVGQGLALLW